MSDHDPIDAFDPRELIDVLARSLGLDLDDDRGVIPAVEDGLTGGHAVEERRGEGRGEGALSTRLGESVRESPER